ncbi:MAG: flagellar capping protein [Clostridia bacterium]|nr:flagellar capping protein [Clostridia bacterium]
MANIAALNTVYNHYLTTYAPKSTTSQYDTHKKSELRSVYNSIVKLNKESPLYLFEPNESTQAFAVCMKENARELKNIISSLSSGESQELLNKKAVSSSDESIVSASYIGNVDDNDDFPTLEIEVKALAQNQINKGTYLPANELGLEPNTYSFDIHVRDLDYEFQFNVNTGDTNKGLQEKLARLINKSNIGVAASVLENEEGGFALQISSSETGLRENETINFSISDNHTSKASGTVSYFGIGNTTQHPGNASFILNGEERSTYSNEFTIDKTFQLSLNGISEEGNSTTIGLKTDLESFTENISHLIQGYNSFLQKASEYIESQPHTGRLLDEMNHISFAYKNNLDSIGLTVQSDGSIDLDKNLLLQTAQEEDALSRFNTIKSFTGSVLNKTNQVSLNPMHYAEKTIVAYKNPGKSYPSPYVTSNYSGMMFNSYC